jgi:hypothetical protein
MLDLFEWIWLAIFLVGLTAELVGLAFENYRRGVEPLTRIVRDRLMRRHRWFGFLIFCFWAWLGFHFFVGGSP